MTESVEYTALFESRAVAPPLYERHTDMKVLTITIAIFAAAAIVGAVVSKAFDSYNSKSSCEYRLLIQKLDKIIELLEKQVK